MAKRQKAGIVGAAAASPARPTQGTPSVRRDKAPTARKRRWPSLRIRLLPLTIFAAALMLTVKVGQVWQDLTAGGDKPPPAAPVVGVAPARAAETHAAASAPNEGGPGRAAGTKPPEVMQGPMVNPTTPPEVKPEDVQGAKGNPFTQAEVDLLQKLAQRRAALDQRAQELDMRENLIKAAEQRIQTKVDEMKQLQASIQELVKKKNAQEEAKLNSLVSIYQNMKPQDAARIFDQLDMGILLEVVERMNVRKAAPILAAMDAAKAREVTAEMAQRRQIPGTINAAAAPAASPAPALGPGSAPVTEPVNQPLPQGAGG